ncbi:hypothetical protein KIN20_031698 [Parelaphostrongylus tenuis]|uniref:Uncharacterized protein n=1 Tax=Parelaphostrongylus tenuis TaxID=148309 RepID=A0AAD5R5I3_PARTN|nr:hypothetical protein KIN20_031698 [Parelaphostrongylus tenuis]
MHTTANEHPSEHKMTSPVYQPLRQNEASKRHEARHKKRPRQYTDRYGKTRNPNKVSERGTRLRQYTNRYGKTRHPNKVSERGLRPHQYTNRNGKTRHPNEVSEPGIRKDLTNIPTATAKRGIQTSIQARNTTSPVYQPQRQNKASKQGIRVRIRKAHASNNNPNGKSQHPNEAFERGIEKDLTNIPTATAKRGIQTRHRARHKKRPHQYTTATAKRGIQTRHRARHKKDLTNIQPQRQNEASKRGIERGIRKDLTNIPNRNGKTRHPNEASSEA